ncbi:MAG: cytochrome c [Rhodospirillaceae bacterium]
MTTKKTAITLLLALLLALLLGASCIFLGAPPVETSRAAEPARPVEPARAADPTVQIEERQREIRKMSAAMLIIGRFLKNEGATVADVGTSADIIRAVAAKMVDGLFPQGTEVGVGRSGARPEVWQQWDMFRERASDLIKATLQLTAAAATGKAEAVQTPIRAVGQACAACHELFRRKRP